MNGARVHRIGHRQFLSASAKTTEKVESAREARLRQQFIEAVPSAGRLQSSELMTHREHTTAGTELHFSLVERPAFTPLPLAGINDGYPVDGDLFQQDIDRVTLECQKIEHRLTLASSPSLSAEQVRGEQPVAGIDVNLRRLFRRRGSKIILPSMEGNREVNVPPRPRHLPVATLVEISATITELRPGYAVLTNAYEYCAQANLWSSHVSLLGLPAQLLAKRKSTLTPEESLRMVACLDGGTRARLQIRLNFRWDTGSVAIAEICSVREATPAN